jgi:hypothetical protein
MYDRFSSVPGFWELDAWTCCATASSPYRAGIIEHLGLTSRSRRRLRHWTELRPAAGCTRRQGGDRRDRQLAQDPRIGPQEIKQAQLEQRRAAGTDAHAYRPDGTVDAALCTFAIEIIPPWRETLDMMAHAVRPGGRIGLIGFKESSRMGYAAFNRLWRAMSVPFGGVELGRPVREHTSGSMATRSSSWRSTAASITCSSLREGDGQHGRHAVLAVLRGTVAPAAVAAVGGRSDRLSLINRFRAPRLGR